MGLCNVVIYKILANVICNRLKPTLLELVDSVQRGFVSRRRAIDNTIVVFEALHSITWNNSRLHNDKYLAIKLDLMKAYDQVSWEFLEFMLHKFNFLHQFIQLLMRCVTLASISIVFNGELFQSFTPSRGLRKGDPLFPLLSVLCMLGLTRLINKYQWLNVWKGISYG